mgnify:CR=1 FL=1
MRMNESKPVRRSRASLSVSSDLIGEAKALGIDLSREAEKGIAQSVRKEKTRR